MLVFLKLQSFNFKILMFKMDDDYEEKWKKRPDLYKIVQCRTVIIGNIHENPELLAKND